MIRRRQTILHWFSTISHKIIIFYHFRSARRRQMIVKEESPPLQPKWYHISTLMRYNRGGIEDPKRRNRSPGAIHHANCNGRHTGFLKPSPIKMQSRGKLIIRHTVFPGSTRLSPLYVTSPGIFMRRKCGSSHRFAKLVTTIGGGLDVDVHLH